MRNYRYAVQRAMRALGGWIALTPELYAKLLLGRHGWDLAHLCVTPALTERADAWERSLEGLLTAGGGVTGDGLPPAVPESNDVPVETSDDAREFIRLEKPTASWPIPEELRAALGAFGDSLLARDREAVARWLAPGVSPDPAREALGAATLTSLRLVAFARLGHQRLVKWRLEGPDASVTVLSRWAPGPEGWRVAML